ncbi:YqiA/YcfP family alpha/beta fold hydrolase [Persephonella sp. KM09-Lau-8]|uniref:YqiA/YcfP family alpha/beta fold hydrolase n=1 Tax=Persephonella sp. KM09-Lau-8 TaxID=1158345 RepID=UPI000496D1E8|nr:YqiA/YcfP family alpha/beta fold hydrolase [Persephonella sp. KM09-Lau-8]
MKVIYIHGFNSAGYGDKVSKLKEHFGDENVLSINLPYNPEKAISLLEYLIRNLKNEEPLLLVGTSLGGAYTLYLSYKFDIPGVIINPSVKPSEDLKTEVGKQKNYKTDEEYYFKEEYLNFLKKIEIPIQELQKIKDKLYIYLDEEDELLDSKETAEYFKGFYVKMFKGGNHRFQHMDELLEDLKSKKEVRYG